MSASSWLDGSTLSVLKLLFLLNHTFSSLVETKTFPSGMDTDLILFAGNAYRLVLLESTRRNECQSFGRRVLLSPRPLATLVLCLRLPALYTSKMISHLWQPSNFCKIFGKNNFSAYSEKSFSFSPWVK